MDLNQIIQKIINFARTRSNLIFASLFVITLLTTFYYQDKYNELKQNPQKAVQDETRKLIDEISKLVVLPDNEEPTIATVSNPELLKDQPFFAKAQKGFKVLIYANAGKSILYDPINHKVVEVASINIGKPTP